MSDDTRGDQENVEDVEDTAEDTGADDASVDAVDEKGEKGDSESFSPFVEIEDADKGDKGDTDSDSIDVDAEDAKVIDARVAPVKEQTARLDSEIEQIKRSQAIDDFLSKEENADYVPFASKMKEIARDSRSGEIKVDYIAKMAMDPKALIEKGARMEREAQKEGRSGITGGASDRPSGPGGDLPNPDGMTDEEFQKTIDRELAKQAR